MGGYTLSGMKTFPATRIATKVRAIRNQRGLTQSHLGALIGLGDVSVTNIEKGRSGLSLQAAYRMELALGLKPGEIAELVNQVEHEAAQNFLKNSKLTLRK